MKSIKKRLDLIEKNYAQLMTREDAGALPEPQPKQLEFINSPAKITLYGGAAGSG